MIQCPHCHLNTKSGKYCDECGHTLAIDRQSDVQRTVDIKNFEEILPQFTWGTAELKRHASLILEVADTATPIVVKPKPQIIVGRGNKTNPNDPDVDFTLHAGAEKGVSRRHAVFTIDKQYVSITDLGSANGTFLNGQQLMSNSPRVVRNGDELHLGKLKLHIYFAKVSETNSLPSLNE